MEYITSRQKVWNRLDELAKIEIMSESERYEEQLLSRYFWETSHLDDVIRHGGYLFYDPDAEKTGIQRRIMRLARYQAL